MDYYCIDTACNDLCFLYFCASSDFGNPFYGFSGISGRGILYNRGIPEIRKWSAVSGDALQLSFSKGL